MQTPEESLHAPESGPNEMPEQSTTSSTGDAVNTELSAENAAEVIAETEIPEEVPFTPAPEEIPATEPAPAEESPEPEDTHVEAEIEAPAEVVQENVVSEPIAAEALKDEEEDATEVDLHEDLQPLVAFQELSRIELVAAMQEAVDSEDTDGMRMRVRAIRDGYYKVKDEEVASKRLKFIENGGLAEEFEILRDETDEQFDALVKRFQEKRAEQRRKREQELITNLRKKEGILAELKAMLENTENISASFDRLHELQEQWRSIGLVPAQYVDELWKNYHHHINNFYDIIKINKELRDLDHKKNLELKTLVCEKAEDLLMEESITKSLDIYKNLQDQWKEIGHVAREHSETIWERFRAAGDKLFDRRREYIQHQEKDYGANLALKNEIVAKAESFLQELPFKSHPQWQEASEKLAALLEDWKKVGFASRKDNEDVWQKFKGIRDQFYAAKEEFYKTLRNAQNHNYKLKVDLCMEAEALRESLDWKKTGERLRQLQESWKTVGPVSKKHNDKLWQRFRTACDSFFENRNKHFAGMNDEQDLNLQKKKDLIARVEAFVPGEDTPANFDALKAFQNEWMEIGHVPIKEKDKLYKAFRTAIDAQFSKLKADSANNRREHFRSQVNSISSDKGGKDKLHHQKVVVQDKIRKLQTDVQTLENNIGFFGNSKSKAAEEMKRDIERKISKAKEEIGQLHDQLRILQEV
ncbi:MAG TPA: DUF349 domain-containing protein [Flavobacteriales bacterium]|nr:DUF349 domain-containing protein [Flavobacteriales bacterium]HPH83193.1 DUF349 domain-containing protein [Flavobacteriales bacterium]